MMNIFYNTEKEQKLRIQKLCNLFSECSYEYLDEKGNWKIDPAPGIRERIWTVHNLVCSTDPRDIVRAQAVMDTLDKDSFGPFEALSAAQMFLFHDETITEKGRDFFNRLLENSIPEILYGSMDFCGVNDNFPFMGMAALAALYRLKKEEIFLDKLRERCGQAEAMLRRRGTVSEYASPTYASFQMHAIALAYEYIKEDDPALAERILAVEHRQWFDQFSRCFEPSANLSGSYTRTSMVDSMGHTNTARGMFWYILGDEVSCSILDTSFKRRAGIPAEINSGNYPWYIQIALTDLGNCIYHCPKYIVEMFKNRQYPHYYKTTSDFSSSNDIGHEILEMSGDDFIQLPLEQIGDYPCQECISKVYMTERYSMGTGTREFHNGIQTDLFHLTYVKDGSENICRRIKTLFTRYTVNGALPREVDGLLPDKGRKMGLQDKNSAMVLYRPKNVGSKNIFKAGLSFCMFSGWNDLDELYLDGCRVTEYPFRAKEVHVIYIRDGQTYLAITPLVHTREQLDYQAEVSCADGFVTVTVYNYNGPAKDFSAKEMMLFANGFGIEVRQADEFGSFEEFRKEFSDPQVSDTMICNEHTRYTCMRETSYQNRGSLLEMEYTPISEGVKYAVINGVEDVFDRIESDELDAGMLPLMK